MISAQPLTFRQYIKAARTQTVSAATSSSCTETEQVCLCDLPE